MSKKNPVSHCIPHDLSLEVAGAAGRKAINGYVSEYSQVSGKWVTPYLFELQAKAAFTKITGKVEITEDAITFHIDHVPAVFSGFIKTAVSAIDKAVKACIAGAKKGK